MKDDYNYRETEYSREMEGQEQDAKECPHGLLIADEDCPDCAEDAKGGPNPHGNHDRWEEVRGER